MTPPPSPLIATASPSIPQSNTSIFPITAPSSSPTHDLIPTPIVSNVHPMQTRLKSGISKKKVAFTFTKPDYLDVEPPSFTIAKALPPWIDAMKEEFSAFHQQGTWSLVPATPSMNLVNCKWVYKIKRNADGSVSRYKARLVAKGFHQQAGINYDEMFSPVVKPTTVRIILTLAAQFNWPLRQLDISNAFLHGFLKEDVHMVQPPGFVDASKPAHVCKLHKSLYGLKQAPRSWFERFTTQLESLGFTASIANPSLFILQTPQATLYLLLYVDDIIITGTSQSFISDLISQLKTTFELKDLGPLHYFLDLQLQYHDQGFSVHQTKYATNLLNRFKMFNCKPSSTPYSSTTKLTKSNSPTLSDPTQFRSLVGVLQYLTFTHPDLSFAVNHICQFMHSPTEDHLMVAKRILHYLRGTLHCVLLFQPSSLKLQGYVDADWAGDQSDRRSTSALLPLRLNYFGFEMILKDLGVFLADSPILWCDNLSALALASNPMFHTRTKHIEVDYHFVCEKVVRRDIVVKFVSTKDQLADILIQVSRLFKLYTPP
uniref:Reverse transcriptase Ty1/copia-type domain-containing protein n=1 Tax=Fagus sylvatica TaxID=28930 RepID=A0A2N9FH85_FAGSY